MQGTDESTFDGDAFEPFVAGRPGWPVGLRRQLPVTAGPRALHTLFVQPLGEGQVRLVQTDGRGLRIFETALGQALRWIDPAGPVRSPEVDFGGLDLTWTGGRAEGEATVLCYELAGEGGELWYRPRVRDGYEDHEPMDWTDRIVGCFRSKDRITATHGWPDAPGGWALGTDMLRLTDLSPEDVTLTCREIDDRGDAARQLAYDEAGRLHRLARGAEGPMPTAWPEPGAAELAAARRDAVNARVFNRAAYGHPGYGPLIWHDDAGEPATTVPLPEGLPGSTGASFRGDLAVVGASVPGTRSHRNGRSLLASRRHGVIWEAEGVGVPGFVGPRSLLWLSHVGALHTLEVDADGRTVRASSTAPLLPKDLRLGFTASADRRRLVAMGSGMLLVLDRPDGGPMTLARLPDHRFNIVGALARTPTLDRLAWNGVLPIDGRAVYELRLPGVERWA